MVYSMDSGFSEDFFTQDYYNDIIVMLEYMDFEGDIYPVSLSTNKNHDEDLPTITKDIVGEEED